ncbi:hypothetical protein QFC20_006780 [Naganishia adeliensis]|uniref:Uncharacterized protein n=1 Tax=Naganishia adeliensis TaxID=92952 RepID=A0ACC2V7T6_9TREE|nr:hypothetical protein QFC20_006780 [Naganishia adeliensis]
MPRCDCGAWLDLIEGCRPCCGKKSQPLNLSSAYGAAPGELPANTQPGQVESMEMKPQRQGGQEGGDHPSAPKPIFENKADPSIQPKDNFLMDVLFGGTGTSGRTTGSGSKPSASAGPSLSQPDSQMGTGRSGASYLSGGGKKSYPERRYGDGDVIYGRFGGGGDC